VFKSKQDTNEALITDPKSNSKENIRLEYLHTQDRDGKYAKNYEERNT
jgi:hypothetical protein